MHSNVTLKPSADSSSSSPPFSRLRADKFKVQQTAPVYKSRAELAKKVKSFWLNALKNCRATAPFLDAVDEQTLTHLEDVWIEHDDKDVRNYEITFVSTRGVIGRRA